MSLFAELKRRNVIRMAGLYLVGALLLPLQPFKRSQEAPSQ